MLYQIGPVALDTTPFNVDEVDRRGQASFAEKPLIGAMPTLEFMGADNDEIDLTGSVLPLAIGGLSQIETLISLRNAGNALPLMRGDGEMLGWFVIVSVRDRHGSLDRNGVGFTVEHTIALRRSSPAQASSNLIPSLLSLFGLGGA